MTADARPRTIRVSVPSVAMIVDSVLRDVRLSAPASVE
jgi:hypothetical protein